MPPAHTFSRIWSSGFAIRLAVFEHRRRRLGFSLSATPTAHRGDMGSRTSAADAATRSAYATNNAVRAASAARNVNGPGGCYPPERSKSTFCRPCCRRVRGAASAAARTSRTCAAVRARRCARFLLPYLASRTVPS